MGLESLEKFKSIDIVERLRKEAYRQINKNTVMQSGFGFQESHKDSTNLEALLDEAADEIEKLRLEKQELMK